MRPGAGVAPLGLPAAVRETLQIFWESPFPATLQDPDFRIVDVNDAFVEFTGFARDALVGRDPIELQPEEDRAANRERRRMLLATHGRADVPALSEGRLIDAARRERWYRAARRVLDGEGGRRSTSRCCRTRPASTSRASAPTARCASSTTGST